MPTIINRDELLRQLECLQVGLSSREILEQSNCFVFNKGQAMTFNGEIRLSCESPFGKAVTGAIKAEPLLNVLRKIPEGEVEIEPAEGELRLLGSKKRRKAGICMEQEITLPVAEIEAPKTWVKLPEDFPEALKIVQRCAGTNERKFVSVCVHLHPKWLEACDEFQLCRWKMKTGFTGEALIRSSSASAIASLGMTEFSEGKNWLHFRNGNGLLLSCCRYMEEFPDLSKFLQEAEGTPVTLPKGLAEAVDVAQVFSAEDKDNNHIRVDIRPGRVKISGRGISGWYSETKKLVGYDGPPIAFLVSPELLMDLVSRHNECKISTTRLIVENGAYKYLACLFDPDQGMDNEEEAPAASEESE